VVRCRDCRSAFVQRSFPESLLEEFYTQKAGGGNPVNRENFGWWLQNTETAIEQILSRIDNEVRGPLLDVGCGYGTLVYLARQRGWDTTGLEINASFATFVRDELKIPCIEALIDDTRLPREHFRIIVLFDVLEHIYSPVDMLRRCWELLIPGGIIVVKSPNWRMQYVKESLKKSCGRGPGNIATIGHINQFDRNSLTRAFSRAGFSTMDVSPSHSFLPGIRGCEFNWKRNTEYWFKKSYNLGVNAFYRVFGANLAFNLLGMARKLPAAVSK